MSDDLSISQQLEELLQFLYLMPAGVVKFDAIGQVQMVNPKAVQLLAGNEQHLHDADALLGALSPELRERWQASAGQLGSIGDPVRVAVDAKPAALVLQLRLVRPDPACCMLTIEDVSELVAQQRRIVEQETQLDAVIEHMQGYAVMSLSSEGHLAEWNASLERQLELRKEHVGQPFDQLPLWEPPDGEPLPASDAVATSFPALSDAMRRTGWHSFARPVWLASGRHRWVECVLAPVVQESGHTTGYVMVVRDDTEGHRRTEHLHREAYTDTLTGLPNRRALLAHVETLISRGDAVRFGAVMVDIDHFKRVNDTYGHEVGDRVLRSVGAALRACSRTNDFVARLGGEEFVIVMDRLDSYAAFGAVERLRVGLEQAAVRAEAGSEPITASFGVAVRREQEGWEALLRRADAATYQAKAAGRNRVMVANDSPKREVEP